MSCCKIKTLFIIARFQKDLFINTDNCTLRSSIYNNMKLNGKLTEIVTGYGINITTCSFVFEYNLQIDKDTEINLQGNNSLRIVVLNGSFILNQDILLESQTKIQYERTILGGYHNMKRFNGGLLLDHFLIVQHFIRMHFFRFSDNQFFKFERWWRFSLSS